MTQESLARRFRPAGFDQPEGSRHEYIKPRPELQEAFDRWVRELPERYIYLHDHYQKALKSLKSLGEIPYRETNSLLAGFKPKTEGQKEAGLFVSACYIHSPEEAIIFDLDAPEIDCIGYRTKKNIFNNGEVGDWFASESSGLAINNGNCGDWFAIYSSGLVVNNGHCGNHFASQSSGLAIAVKEPKIYGIPGKNGKILKPADCERIPDLKRYLEELSEFTKSIKDEESAKKFVERYGCGGEKIKPEIEELFRKGWFEI